MFWRWVGLYQLFFFQDLATLADTPTRPVLVGIMYEDVHPPRVHVGVRVVARHVLEEDLVPVLLSGDGLLVGGVRGRPEGVALSVVVVVVVSGRHALHQVVQGGEEGFHPGLLRDVAAVVAVVELFLPFFNFSVDYSVKPAIYYFFLTSNEAIIRIEVLL